MNEIKWKENNLTAYIGGTFDILHAGHVNLIKKVKEMGIRPIIVVNGDNFVEQNNKNCVYSAKERATALVEFFPDETIEIIERMKDQRSNISNKKPNFIVVGTDWMRPEILPQLGIDDDFLRTYNIAMLFIPRFNSISSTSIKETIIKNM
jgi:glycerol-3-phosphate cytidylyltransferase